MAIRSKYMVIGWLLLISGFLSLAAENYVFFDENEYELSFTASKEFELEGETGDLFFDAKCSAWSFGRLKVEAQANGEWKTVTSVAVTEDYKNYGPFRLNKATTKLRFYTESGATFFKNFKNIAVTEAHYIEVRDTLPVFSEKERRFEQSITVHYAHIVRPISVTSKHPDFMILQPTETVGSSDERDSCIVCVLFLPSGNVSEGVIEVTDGRDTLLISVTGVVNDTTYQFIYWNQNFNALHVGDVVPLTAIASSRLPIEYNLDGTETVEVRDGCLVAKKEGLAVLSAEQSGNSRYKPAAGISAYVSVSLVGLSATAADNVVLFPNPTNHYFEVRSDKAISEIAVIDFSGRQLMAIDGGSAKHVTVSVSHLTAGVYMVAVKGNDFYWLRKLIVY